MEGSRRDVLKFGAAAAPAPLAARAFDRASAAEATSPAAAVPNDKKLRLFSYSARDGAPRLAALSANGRAIDIATAAEAAKVKLGFDGTSMLALIEAGPDALAKVRDVVQSSTVEGPLVSE